MDTDHYLGATDPGTKECLDKVWASKRKRKDSMNKYEKIEPISRTEAEAVIRGGKTEDIPLTLVRLAYHEPDWLWVQDLCIGPSDHPDKSVRRVCAICFSHLARIHGKLEREKVNAWELDYNST